MKKRRKIKTECQQEDFDRMNCQESTERKDDCCSGFYSPTTFATAVR